MKKFNVYVTRLIPVEGLTLLRESCTVEINPEDRPLTRDELLKNVKGRDGVISLLNDRIDGEVMEAAKGIKGFANYAVGFDNFDRPGGDEAKDPHVQHTGGSHGCHSPDGLGPALRRCPPRGGIGQDHAHRYLARLGPACSSSAET